MRVCQVAKHIKNIKWQLVFVEDSLNPTIAHTEAGNDRAMG